MFPLATRAAEAIWMGDPPPFPEFTRDGTSPTAGERVPADSICPGKPREPSVPFLQTYRAVQRQWRLALLTCASGIALAVTYSMLATPQYRATAVLVPPKQRGSNALANLAALGELAPEFAAGLGLTPSGVDANRLNALLNSHRLLYRVVKNHRLLQMLFPARWDSKAARWLPPGQTVPTVWDAKEEMKEIYSTTNDSRAGVLRISIELPDPQLATEALNFFIQELAAMIQEDEIRSIETIKQFIIGQLATASDPITLSKLNSLLADQIEKSVMAQNTEHLAFELIDPPAASRKKVWPKRGIIIGVSTLVSLFAAILLATVRAQVLPEAT